MHISTSLVLRRGRLVIVSPLATLWEVRTLFREGGERCNIRFKNVSSILLPNLSRVGDDGTFYANAPRWGQIGRGWESERFKGDEPVQSTFSFVSVAQSMIRHLPLSNHFPFHSTKPPLQSFPLPTSSPTPPTQNALP